MLIMVDTGEGKEGEKGVKLYFSNPDLLWKARYNVPRFGQGAFKEAFQAVFKVRPVIPFLLLPCFSIQFAP